MHQNQGWTIRRIAGFICYLAVVICCLPVIPIVIVVHVARGTLRRWRQNRGVKQVEELMSSSEGGKNAD